MRPFLPSFHHLPNQIQTEGSNGSAIQQVMVSNSCLPNSNNLGTNFTFPHYNPLVHSQLLSLNPRFPVPFDSSNNHLSNLNGNFVAMPNTHFLNVGNHHPPVQNNYLGMPLLHSSTPHDLSQPHGQFCSQNALQNLNPVASSPLCGQLYNGPHNLNQIAPSHQHGQFVHNHPQVMNHCRPLQQHMCANMPGGQFISHNLTQHMNQFTGVPHGQFSQHPIDPSQAVPSSMTPCSHPLLGCSNQVAQTLGSQNPTFLMHPQLGMGNSNGAAQHNNQDQHMFMPPTKVQSALQESPIVAQNLQRNLLPSTNGQAQMQQTQKNLQPSTFQTSQGNHFKDDGNNVSNINQGNPQSRSFTRNPGNPQIKNFTTNHHKPGKRESTNMRFQKSNFHPMANAKGNFRPFNGKGGKGYRNEGERKSHMGSSTKQARVECRSSIPLNYTEQEIQQWREERRKNYPTKSNVEKLAEKQTQSEAIDMDAKKRRQQLKEILAKQAELGVEVAELPPNYLSDSEIQVCRREEENRTWTKKGRFQNKYGKRGKHDNVGRFSKKQKLGDNGSSTTPSSNKRKPTLLQKLLSADIKRDKSHLLQVFRFMVMNSFFKDWPEKPLEFPSITIKDMEGTGEVVENNSHGTGLNAEEFEDPDHSMENEGGDNNDDENGAEVEEMVHGYAVETDCIREEIENSEGEEGEITD